MTKGGFTFILNKVASFLDSEQVFSDIFKSVDPSRWFSEWGQPDTADDELPEHLMIRIADKEDAKKIEEFFNSRVENNTDPNEYVKPRSNDKVVVASNLGRIAIIEDHNHEIVTVCFGYTHRVDDMPNHETSRMISEMGTVLSSVKGLGLSSIAISALSLSIHNKEGGDHPLIAKVSTGNSAANALFGKSLKWETIEDKENVRAIFNSSAGDTIRESYGLDSGDGDATKDRKWYLFGEAAADNARELLQELFETGYIVKNNKKIIFEFDKDDFNFELNEGNDELAQELHEIFDNKDEIGDLESYFAEYVFMDRDDASCYGLGNNQP